MVFRNRIGISRTYNTLAKVLCIWWLITIAYNELGTFSRHVRRCEWPDAALELQVCSILVIRANEERLRILSGRTAASMTP